MAEALARAWARFRAWPLWAQILTWVVIGLLVIGAAVPNEEETTEIASTGATTTSTERTSTSTTEPEEEEAPAIVSEPRAEVPDPTGDSGHGGAPSVGASAAEGQDLVGQLTVAAEGPRTGYDRDLFDHWSDLDGDGCDTREEVLIAEDLNGRPHVDPSGCKVIAGDWLSVYDGYTTDDPTELHIDHVVALAEAWDSGASSWTPARREAFANDLGYPHALVAVTGASNLRKSDKDPAEWQPSSDAAWCWFATAWTQTKVRWGLTADPAEVQALSNMIVSCDGGQATATTPPPATSPPPTSPPTTPPPGPPPPPPPGGCPNGRSYTTADGSCIDSHDDDGNGDVNCSEVDSSAKPVQVHGDDPHGLDGDGDGVACES